MNKIEKGTYGYIRGYKKTYLVLTLVLVALIVVGVSVILAFKGTMKTAWAVFPVLLALPLAKAFIGWYIVARFRPLGEEDVEKIQAAVEGRANCVLLFDTAISAYEAVSYSLCTVIDQGDVYLLWGGSYTKEYKDYQQREYVQKLMDGAKLPYRAFTVKSTEELLEKIASATVSPEDLTDANQRLRQRILDVCV